MGSEIVFFAERKKLGPACAHVTAGFSLGSAFAGLFLVGAPPLTFFEYLYSFLPSRPSFPPPPPPAQNNRFLIENYFPPCQFIMRSGRLWPRQPTTTLNLPCKASPIRSRSEFLSGLSLLPTSTANLTHRRHAFSAISLPPSTAKVFRHSSLRRPINSSLKIAFDSLMWRQLSRDVPTRLRSLSAPCFAFRYFKALRPLHCLHLHPLHRLHLHLRLCLCPCPLLLP